MRFKLFFGMIIAILFCLSFGFAEQLASPEFIPLSLTPYPGKGKLEPSQPGLILSLDNIQINSDNTAELQNEEMVCINPTNTDNAVAVWRDFRLGYRRIGVGYTFDGGQTWTDELVVPYSPYGRQSDPVLWVDRDGVFYLSGLDLYWDQGPSGISVYKSTDGGITWSEPTWVVQEQYEYFEDKQWFAMDQTGSTGDGNIYCVWDRFSSSHYYTGIVCASSTDGGLTFSEPVEVSVYGPNYVQWPTVTVGPQSVVHVAWYDHRHPRRISIAKSYDYGISFEPEYSIATLDSAYSELNGEIMSFPFPAMMCDIYPESDYYGSLYVIYSDGEADWDIWCVSSTDDGESWSEKVRVNDDPQFNGCDQFHPWLSIDNDGVIHVCFLDRRDDPGNMLYNLYYTRSTDGGQTWEVNHRISTVSSDPGHAGRAGLLGEYIGISAWDGEVQMVWTDVRNFNQDAFSARISRSFVPGDVNGNSRLLGNDIAYLVSYFRDINPVPDPPIWRADANGDCEISPADITYLLMFFKGIGEPPVDGNCR